MSQYKTAGAVGLSKLFNEKAPNLIPQAVMDAIDGKGTIVSNLFALNVNGYSKNVRNYYTYGKNHYTEGLPEGRANRYKIVDSELHRAATIEAKKHFVHEAALQESIAASLKASLGPVHPDYLTAQSKADNTLLLSTTLTITAHSSEEVIYPDADLKVWQDMYTNIGLFYPSDADENEHIPFLANTPGFYPITKIDHVTYEAATFFEPNKGTVTVSYEDALGAITYQDFYTGNFERTIPSSPGSIWNIPRPYILTYYTVNELPSETNGVFIWVYDTTTNEYPNLYLSNLENVNKSDVLPIATIRRAKEFISPDLNEDDEPEDELGRSAYKMLKKVVVDMKELQDALEKAPDGHDIDDAHVGFLANITSEIPATIKYNILFFEALREYNGVFPEDDYESSNLAEQDAFYKKYYPDVYGLAWIDDYIGNIPKPIDYVKLNRYTYEIRSTYDQEQNIPWVLNKPMASINTAFIYKEIIVGSIGKLGSVSIYIEDESEGYERPSDKIMQRLGMTGVGFIEYKQQITNETYKLIRVHNPVMSFSNFWFGDTWADGGMDTFRLQFDLRDSTPGIEDSKTMMAIPMLYNIVRKFSGISETKVYYDSLSMLMFTVIVTLIPWWVQFLQIIFILIFAFIAPILGALFAVITVVVTIVTRIVVSVISKSKGAKEGAIAGAGIGITLSILTLGSTITVLLDNLVKLTLAILGLVLEIVNLVQSVEQLNFEKEYFNLLEDMEEEDEDLNKLSELLDTGTDFDPLKITDTWKPYRTADEYFELHLDLSTLDFVIDTVYNYERLALNLPEEDYNYDYTNR